MNGLAALARAIDRVNEHVGRVTAWLTLFMVLIAFVVVVLRYVFSIGFVWLQESYVWLHGIVFMIGAGYTLLWDGHVRVDILYREKGPLFRAWVDLFGCIVLLAPFVIMVWLVAWPYVLASWDRVEESREAGGLPGLFLLKSILLVFCVLLGLQALSLGARALLVIGGRPEKPPGPDAGLGGRET